MNTNYVMKKVGHSKCHSIIAMSSKGYLIIADAGGVNLIVTTCDANEPDTLTRLLGAVLRLSSSQF